MEENKSETVWKRNQFVGKTALELWKGFVWSVNYSWSNYQSTYSAYNTRNSQLEGIGNKNGQATRNTYFGREQTFETYLNYDFKVGKSKWGLMGGYSWEEKKNNDGFGLSVEGYYNDDLGWYNMSYAQTILGVQNSVQSGYLEKVRNISFYGRVNYSLTVVICFRQPFVVTVLRYSARTIVGELSLLYLLLGISLRRSLCRTSISSIT